MRRALNGSSPRTPRSCAECADPDCTERVEAPLGAYEEVRVNRIVAAHVRKLNPRAGAA